MINAIHEKNMGDLMVAAKKIKVSTFKGNGVVVGGV